MNVTVERTGTARRPVPAARPAPALPGDLDARTLAARRRSAALVGLATLASAAAALAILIVRANGGSFTYVIDDPYIHLSMARNLAHSGTFGVVAGTYESASSSPGWVALLAALITVTPGGGNVWLPLALNLVAAGGVLLLVLDGQRFLYNLHPAPLRLLAYILLPLALYLPALVFLGMEHTFHALLAVALLLVLARALQRRLDRGELAGLAALSLLAGAIRYETLFLAGGAALALVLVPTAVERESRAQQFMRGALARLRRPELWAFLLPPLAVTVVLGLINLAHGQYFLPNSVLVKSGLGAGQGLAGWIPTLAGTRANLTADVQVEGLALIGLGYLALRRLRGEQSGLWLAWLVALLLHAGYAKFGWYDRYQAYLAITGLLLALRSAGELAGHRRIAAALLGAVLLAGLPVLKFGNEVDAPDNAHGVYLRQAQLGRFLATAYAGRTVLVNDIGEVSWQHSGGLDDLWALGSNCVLRAFRSGQLDSAFVARLAAGDDIRVAAVYGVLRTYIPASWTEVARWSSTGTHRPDPDGDIVFYASSPVGADTLRAAMRAFAPTLPHGIEVLWTVS